MGTNVFLRSTLRQPGKVLCLVLVAALRAISRDDLALMPKGDKIARLLGL